MNHKRGLFRLLALLFAFSMIAAACSGSDSEGGSSETENETETEETTATTSADTEVAEVEEAVNYGGTVTVGLEAEAVGMRPWEDTCASPCYNILGTIYDKLFEIDTDFVPQPYLAESYTVNDELTEYVVTLRSGVTFHDGTPLTGQTIADMFEVQLTGSTSAGSISTANLESVVATGDLEVTYTLSQANSAFLAALTRAPLGMVFEPAAAAADPDAFNLNPIGTGPFTLTSRDLDNATIVSKYDGYWGADPDGNQLPYLDSIEFRPIPDEGTRLDSLLSGTVTAMQSLRQGTIRDARAAGDSIALYEFQGNNLGGGMYNVQQVPLDDVRVRRGLTQLNPQDQVIEALGGTGISLPGTQWFSPDSPWWSQAAADAWPKFDFEAGVASLQSYIDDPERSDGKAVGEPIDVELSCPPDPTLIAATQVLADVWTQTELVNVELTNFDQQTHINNALGAAPDFGGTHGVHCWRWSSDEDPSLTLNPFLAPPNGEVAEAAGLPGVVSALNFSNWFNGDAFGAALAAVQTEDFDERYALYEQVSLLIAEEVPIYFSGHTATMIATDPNVLGVAGWHLPSGELGAGLPAAEGRWQEVFISE